MIQLIIRFKAFHSAISKTIIGVQEANSPYSIKKSHFQPLRRRENESRSYWKQEIQGWWCLDSSTIRKHPIMIYNIEEHLNSKQI